MSFLTRLFARKSKIRLPDGGCIRLTDMLAKTGSWEDRNRNVVRLDKRGNVVWRIETRSDSDESSPYTAVSIQNGVLTAYSWSGVRYVVDLESGELDAGVLVR